MEASITGAGLILAMYALVVPMSRRIFEENVNALNVKIKKFEDLKSKITPESNNKEMKQLNNLRSEIKDMRNFPYYLGIGVVITFSLYIISTTYDVFWLTNPTQGTDIFLAIVFIVATFSFFLVGLGAIFSIFRSMKKEFEEITKKQNEIKGDTLKIQESVIITNK